MAAREDTLPGLMLRNAQIRPTKPAMREKDLGIWRTYSWADYAAQVQDFALGLAQMGREIHRRGTRPCEQLA